LADHVVCASQFTRATLLEAGANNGRISVIPYGVTLPTESDEVERDQIFHVLFVGSGIQRKGLHHLLLAWRRARLPAGSVLTLVCRILEPAFAPMIASTPSVRLMREVTYAQLARLYRSATLFAMPSLVEGFGQVYLEALSYGLPVLGTRHTCVPDLGDEVDGVYCHTVGDLDALIDALERLSKILPGKRDMNRQARLCAARFSWERFRSNIGSLI
jgi:glycosyltransferase involved in cell wall biosynthesis